MIKSIIISCVIGKTTVSSINRDRAITQKFNTEEKKFDNESGKITLKTIYFEIVSLIRLNKNLGTYLKLKNKLAVMVQNYFRNQFLGK